MTIVVGTVRAGFNRKLCKHTFNLNRHEIKYSPLRHHNSSTDSDSCSVKNNSSTEYESDHSVQSVNMDRIKRKYDSDDDAESVMTASESDMMQKVI